MVLVFFRDITVDGFTVDSGTAATGLQMEEEGRARDKGFTTP